MVSLLLSFVTVAACGAPYDSEATPEVGCTPACGPHGRCEASKCVCDGSFGGPTCTECTAGANPDGTCGAKCGANTCKLHESCTDGASGPSCACVKGYVAENGACVFRGGPRDPGFTKMPDAWVVSGLVTVEPSSTEPTTLSGQVDPGWARFFGTGQASQTFDMPEWQLGEPLAVETSTGCRRDCDDLADRAVAVRIGGRGSLLPLSPNGLTKNKWCLGERAYGAGVTFDLRAVGRDGPGPGGGNAKPEHHGFVDHVRFFPAPECPLPGQIPNANFDANGGWVGSGTGVAEVANAVGTNGSRAAHLRANGGEGPILTGIVSVPHRSIAHPALVSSYRTQNGRTGQVRLGPTIIGVLGGTGGFEEGRICFPEWSKGRAHALAFGATSPALVGDPTDLLVDDLRLVDDPTCGEAPLVRDPGFEGNVRSRPWVIHIGGAPTTFTTDAASARSGSGAVSATITACNTSGGVYQSITVPPPSATGGPAARFWYKANLPLATTASGGAVNLVPAAPWTQRVTCLPPRLEGFEYELRFVLSAGANCNGGGTLNVDDVEVTTDPSCPKE